MVWLWTNYMGIDKVSSCRISASESLMMPVGVYIDSFQAKPVQGGTLFEHLSIAPHQMYHGCSHLFVSLKGKSICYMYLLQSPVYCLLISCLVWGCETLEFTFWCQTLHSFPNCQRVCGLFLFHCGNLVCTLGNTQTLAGVIAFRLHCYQQSSNSRNAEMKNNIKITNSKQLTNCRSGLLISSGSLIWCSLQISGMRLNGPWMEWLCKT